MTNPNQNQTSNPTGPNPGGARPTEGKPGTPAIPTTHGTPSRDDSAGPKQEDHQPKQADRNDKPERK